MLYSYLTPTFMMDTGSKEIMFANYVEVLIAYKKNTKLLCCLNKNNNDFNNSDSKGCCKCEGY